MWGNKIIPLKNKTKSQKTQKPESHCPRESACSARTTCGLWAIQVMILFHDQHWVGSEPQIWMTPNRGWLRLMAGGHWEQAVWQIQPCPPVVLQSNWPSPACKVFLGSVQLSRSAVLTCGSWPCEDFSIQLVRVRKAGHLCFTVSSRSHLYCQS